MFFGEEKLEDTKDKQLCPNCGKPMEFVKSVKKPIDLSKSKKSINLEEGNDEGYSILEIWHCLNCNATWELEIYKNNGLLKK